jgi:hypothetical protein
MFTPPATALSGFGQAPGQPIDGLGPVLRRMGPDHPKGSEGAHVPVQLSPLELEELAEEALELEAAELEAAELEAAELAPDVLEVDALEVDAPPIPDVEDAELDSAFAPVDAVEPPGPPVLVAWLLVLAPPSACAWSL